MRTKSVESYIASLADGVTIEQANAGTSEGVKKGWEHRVRALHEHLSAARKAFNELDLNPEHETDEIELHRAALQDHISNAIGRLGTLRDSAQRQTRIAKDYASKKEFGKNFTDEELADHHEALIGSAKGKSRADLLKALKGTDFEEHAYS